MSRHVRIRTPATVGNFGPGFDTFSLALREQGDVLDVVEAGEDRIDMSGPGAEDIPTAWRKNVAGVVLDVLRARLRVATRYHVRILKRRPGGSGLGSSAASAAGAALAFRAFHVRRGLRPEDLVKAAAAGEAIASGEHYDDVAAVIQGGLSLVRLVEDDVVLTRIEPPRGLHVAVVAPHYPLPTRAMRRILPRLVRREDAVHNLGHAAALVHAFHEGDIAAIGGCLHDRIATPSRKSRIPFYEDVRRAATDAGALGVAISGSGPSMIAVCDSKRLAERVASTMRGPIERRKLRVQAFAAQPERRVMWHQARVR